MTQPSYQPGDVEREFGVAVPRADRRAVEVDADRAQGDAGGPAQLEGTLRPRRAGRARPRLRQRPLPHRLGAHAAGPRPPRHRHPAVVIRYARKRGNQRGLANLQFAVLGGRELLEKHVPPHSVAEIHCYHPQPYYDPAKVHLRLITPQFVALVHRALVPGGLFVMQTDNPGYWRYIQEVVPFFFDFHETDRPLAGRAEGPHAAGDHRAQEEAAGVPRTRHGEDGPERRRGAALGGVAPAADVRRRPTTARTRPPGMIRFEQRVGSASAAHPHRDPQPRHRCRAPRPVPGPGPRCRCIRPDCSRPLRRPGR